MLRNTEEEKITVHLRFHLTKGDFNRFIKLCNERNINASELVSNMLSKWISEQCDNQHVYDVFNL